MKKYDLHCHLDGSLSESCIRKLANLAGVSLENLDLKQELQAKMDCKSLVKYLEKFDLPLRCLVSKESFVLAVKDVMKTASEEGIDYIEIRFAPMLSVREDFTANQIIEAAIEGLKEGEKEYPIKGNLILCGMRHHLVERNVELVHIAKEYVGYGVCGLDLAGDEAGFPVTLHAEMFRKARELQIPFTIHAGECKSAKSIWDAIELGASRIGHGIAAKDDPKLMEYCKEHQIFFEMCPISNLQTKAVNSMEEYPFLDFLKAGIPVTINTDNRTVSNTSISKEWKLLKEYYHLEDEVFEELMKNGEKARMKG